MQRGGRGRTRAGPRRCRHHVYTLDTSHVELNTHLPVPSAGEFEKGLTGGGQTREHAQLIRSLGVGQLVVAVNKMDGPLVAWSAERFGAIKAALTPFLVGAGFALGSVAFVPVSGLTGQNLTQPPAAALAAGGHPVAASAGGSVGSDRDDSRAVAPSAAAAAAAGASAAAPSPSAAADAAEAAAKMTSKAREMLEDMGLDDIMGSSGSGSSSGAVTGYGGSKRAGAGAAPAPTPEKAAAAGDDASSSTAAWAPTPAALTALASWYVGPTLLGALERCAPPPARTAALTRDKPLRFVVSDVGGSGGPGAGGGGGGVTVTGRVEGGYLTPHTRVLLALPGAGVSGEGGGSGPAAVGGGGSAAGGGTPAKAAGSSAQSSALVTATIRAISLAGTPVPAAVAGDVVDVSLGGLGGLDEARLLPGSLLTWPTHPVRAVGARFKAYLAALPGLTLPIVPGQQFTLHSGGGWEEPCNVTRLLRCVRPDAPPPVPVPGGAPGGSGGDAVPPLPPGAPPRTLAVKPRLLTSGQAGVVRIRLARPMPLEPAGDHRRLGRFVLRYGGATVAAGLMLRVGGGGGGRGH